MRWIEVEREDGGGAKCGRVLEVMDAEFVRLRSGMDMDSLTILSDARAMSIKPRSNLQRHGHKHKYTLVQSHHRKCAPPFTPPNPTPLTSPLSHNHIPSPLPHRQLLKFPLQRPPHALLPLSLSSSSILRPPRRHDIDPPKRGRGGGEGGRGEGGPRRGGVQPFGCGEVVHD